MKYFSMVLNGNWPHKASSKTARTGIYLCRMIFETISSVANSAVQGVEGGSGEFINTVYTQGVFLPPCGNSGACVQWAAKSLNKNMEFCLTYWEATPVP